jgi:hypothetical protein
MAGTYRKRRYFTADEDTVIRARYPDELTADIAADMGRTVTSVFDRAARLGVAKSAAYLAKKQVEHTARLTQAGIASRIKPGETPWNKGMKGLQIGGGGTRFAPGNRPHNWREIGSEELRGDGHLYRKITDDGPPHAHCRPVYLLLWEAAHGRVPRGHAVIFRDGNYSHITLENLELVSRRDLMARNTIHRYPQELKDLIRLKGSVTRIINKRDKGDEKQT